MGPTIIFDKSFLQALNPHEAMWLDNFFISNITPLLYIENLADLEKEVKAGRTPEEVVGNLANKTPDMGKPNVHHLKLLEGELYEGRKIKNEDGQIYISGGIRYELDGKKGVVFQPSKEEEALTRWRNHEFLDLERQIAKKWRMDLSTIDLNETYVFFKKFFPMGKPKNLADVKMMVDFYINGPDREFVLNFGLTLLGVSSDDTEEVIKRWRREGKPQIVDFAPYFYYVFSVDLFFNLAISADLIGRGRPSHKIDLSYLYYLPFCMVFVSNDKLHEQIVPFFIRGNQTFVRGSELKSDLSKLDSHYDLLPDKVKETGVISFAFYPPKDDQFLVTRLWDKHMSSRWRERDVMPKPQPDSEFAKKLSSDFQKIKEQSTTESSIDFDLQPEDVESMFIERRVRGKVGKWTLFPPEVMNRHNNKDNNSN